MTIERRGHPANWLHEELFSIPKGKRADIWWSGMENLVTEMENLNDLRSVASVCFTIALSLKERAQKRKSEREVISGFINNRVLPLWEREIKKDSTHLSIADNVSEFCSVAGEAKSKEIANWGAIKLKDVLPAYNLVHTLYPDEGIENGIHAVMVGKKGWYAHMAELFKFAEVVKDVDRVILVCKERDWLDELDAWKNVRDYFNNFLLRVDIIKVDPRLVEHIYQNSANSNMDPQVRTKVDEQYTAWKDIRNPLNGWDSANETLN